VNKALDLGEHKLKLGYRMRKSTISYVMIAPFFAFFIFTAALNCFNARSDRLNLFAGLSKNPTFVAIIAFVSIIQAAFIYLGSSVMRTVPLAPSHLALTVLLSLPVIIFEFARKLWQRLSPRK
jgi:magnesium-transporting ATPase (P-type)